MQPVYLRGDIQVEPLVDRWYAWSHLIAPATAARNMTDRHFRIMESYLQTPKVHEAAVKNPRMLGGPFMDYPECRVEEVRSLRDATARARAPLIELSAAIAELDEMLRCEANGSTLEPLYERVPDGLRGYVELVYDRDHHASFRLIEPLLYRSRYYQPDAQSLMLSAIQGDDRPFVMSTPRLPQAGTVPIPRSFADAAVDTLFQCKTRPGRWEELRDALGVEREDEAQFRSFFTSDAPRPYARYEGAGARWRYFGHACILVETASCNVLLDPVLSYTYESGLSRYTYDDLPDQLDFVLITHNHQDHVLLETLLQLRHKARLVVVPRSCGGRLEDPSLSLALRAIGFTNVVELGEFEELVFPGGRIVAVPFLGEHADLAVQSKLGYVVRVGAHSLMFAADSRNLEPRMYDHIRAALDDIDVLFLGMECVGAPLSWLYGPLFTRPVARSVDQSRRLAGSNCEQAAAMVERLRCKQLYVYAMGQEPWLRYVMSIRYDADSEPIVESNRLLAACQARGLVAERLFGEREILLD
jgi:L-ascorbate metabolism protein UlaG (beta-lactamase superfamily)